MKMSRADFAAVAKIIADEADNSRTIICETRGDEREREGRLNALRKITPELADMFAKVTPLWDLNGNRRFDRAEFIAACKIEED